MFKEQYYTQASAKLLRYLADHQAVWYRVGEEFRHKFRKYEMGVCEVPPKLLYQI
jgi:hypothetical protein